MKSYAGTRSIDGVLVTVDHAPLPTHADLMQYSRSGFEWSYEGAEPRQLAFALLYDHLKHVNDARSLSEAFMRAMVANFDNDWEMTTGDMNDAIAALRSASPGRL